jgi:hypothetical protein
MTTPVADPRLVQAAGWDVPLLRGAVATLTAVAGRLFTWRLAVEQAGRALEGAECWSGPAAREAAGAVLRLSSVTVGVGGGLGRSLEAFERLAAEAAAGHELALTTLVAPDPAAAEEALGHLARVAAAASRADEALRGLGVVDAFGPVSFAALAGSAGVAGIAAPPLPPDPTPDAVAAWWAGLRAADQRSAIAARPELVGGLDGVPAWARDRANRLLLARALADDHLPAHQAITARAVDQRLAELQAAGQPAQVHTLDLAGDRVAVGLGDLDTATVVAVLVPGIMATPAGDLGRWSRTGRAVADAARRAGAGPGVATLVWLGYRTPQELPTVVTRFAAQRGGTALAGDLDGLAAAREAAGRPPARTTVIAHSYGTVVVDEAADVDGRLAADAVVLLGSPGMEGDAADLEAPQVYVGAAPGDPVSWLGWFGEPPSWDRFGARQLPADAGTGHSEWFDADHPTLAAIGEVVAGGAPTGAAGERPAA